jgi:hypothetical protein
LGEAEEITQHHQEVEMSMAGDMDFPSVVRVDVPPTWVEGRIARIVRLADGAGRVETWDAGIKSWVVGSEIGLGDFLPGKSGAALTSDELKSFGIPS